MSTVYMTRRGMHPRTGRSMARFYKLFITPSLFGEWVLNREWGRIGAGGTVRTQHYPTSDAATAAMRQTVRLKEKRGYKFPIYSQGR